MAAGSGKGGALAHLLRRLAGAGAAPTAGVQVRAALAVVVAVLCWWWVCWW